MSADRNRSEQSPDIIASSAPADSGAHEIIAGIEGAELTPLAVSGATWSVGLLLLRQVISMGATAVLSRILSPGDYGLIGMTATLVTFLQVFCDMGLSWATLSRKEITRGQMDNLFWANLSVGGLLWLLSIAASPVVARFYHQQELVVLTMVVGTNFLLGGLAVQPIAVLRRQMRIRELSLVELASLIFSTAAGLTSALLGWGYWSLAIQSLVGQSTMAIGALIVSGYRPHMPRMGRGTLSLLQFGGWITMAGIPIFLTRNLDQILIGKRWGTVELGLYNRAYFLMMWPSLLSVMVLTGVMVPLFSSLQEDKERLARVFRKTLRMVAFMSFPTAIGLAVTAPGVVRLIYGEKWADVVPILTYLSIASAFQPIYNANGWLYISCGKGKAMFCWYLVAVVVFGVAFAIGLPWKGVGVAISYVVVMVPFATVGSCWFSHRAVGLDLKKTLLAVAPMLAASVSMGLIVSLVGVLLTRCGIHHPWSFGIKVLTGIVSYIVLSAWVFRCWPEGLTDILRGRLLRKRTI